MKLKTSITLSEDLASAVRRVARKGESRSRSIERLLREALAARAAQERDAADLATINRHARALNREAEEVLAYQVDV